MGDFTHLLGQIKGFSSHPLIQSPNLIRSLPDPRNITGVTIEIRFTDRMIWSRQDQEILSMVFEGDEQHSTVSFV